MIDACKTTYSIHICFLDFFPCHFTFPDLSGVFININKGRSGILGQFGLFNLIASKGTFHGLFGKEGCASWLTCSNVHVFPDGGSVEWTGGDGISEGRTVADEATGRNDGGAR